MADEHTLNLRPPVWLPILVALIAGGLYVAGKFVEATYIKDPAMITVSADAKAAWRLTLRN